MEPGAETRDAVILWQVRLPRILAALSVGAALAVAGAIMQAMTGNPLADPGLLGVNAGAAFAVVLALVILGPGAAQSTLIRAAFTGAAGAAGAVLLLGQAGRGGEARLRLVLAGVVVATLLGGLTLSVLMMDGRTLDAVRLWTAGSLRGRQMEEITAALPFIGIALALALAVRDQFTALGLGQHTGRSLGQNRARWQGLSAALVVVLAGSAVAIAGPVGFVGLVVPHMARLAVGSDYRLLLPLALPGGALLTLLADLLPRGVWGNDVPVGISMALVGAPFFIWLARRRPVGG